MLSSLPVPSVVLNIAEVELVTDDVGVVLTPIALSITILDNVR